MLIVRQPITAFSQVLGIQRELENDYRRRYTDLPFRVKQTKEETSEFVCTQAIVKSREGLFGLKYKSNIT